MVTHKFETRQLVHNRVCQIPRAPVRARVVPCCAAVALWEGGKKGRKEERKKGRKEERKKGRKEERKKGRKEERSARCVKCSCV